LNADVFSQPVEEEYQDLLKALTERYTPEQIAAAFLNREVASYPAAEEVSDAPVHPVGGKKPRERSDRGDRGDRFERSDRRERGEPGERFDRNSSFDGVWFSVSAGRKHRADPKWLLPLICKAGDVSKRDVGSIKIFDNETRFEITAAKADEFRRSVEERGTGEKGLVIRNAVAGAGGDASPREGKGNFKPRGDKFKSDFRDGPRDGNRDNARDGAKGSWSKPKGDFKKDGFKKDGKKFGDGGFSKKRRGE
jgi:ATP-dependent RNA helicase DeaD